MLLITNINGEAIVADGEFLKEIDSKSLKDLNRAIENGSVICDDSGKISYNGKSVDLTVQQIFTILGNFIVYSKDTGISSLFNEESESSAAAQVVAGGAAVATATAIAETTTDENESVDRLDLGSSEESGEDDTRETINLFGEDKEEEDDIDLDSLFESLADEELELEQEAESEADKESTCVTSEETGEEDVFGEMSHLLEEEQEESSTKEKIEEVGKEISEEEDILGEIEDFFAEDEETIEVEEKVKNKTEEKAEDVIAEDEYDILSDLENILAEELESEGEKSDKTERVDKGETAENIDDLDILGDLDILSEGGEDKKDDAESTEDELLDIFDLDELEEKEPEEKGKNTQNENIGEEDDLLGLLDEELSLTDIKIEDEGKEEEKTDLDDIDIIPLADETKSESEPEVATEEKKEKSEISKEEPLEKSSVSELEDIIPLAEDVESKDESISELSEMPETPAHTDSKMPTIEELTAEGESEVDKSSPVEAEVASIDIDLEDRAELLEIDTEEYKSLFMDFISDAREMKENLLSSDDESIRDTISILKDAVLLLQLQALKNMLADIEASDGDNRKTAVDRFYLTLDAIESEIEAGNTKIVLGTPSVTESAKSESIVESEIVPETESVIVESESVEEQQEEATEAPSSDKLTADDILEGVKPIPIEFSLHIASEELSLPEDLVLEFISDFAQQAHENLPVLIEEYRNNELDKLQKTAHMLKGAASNLRIEQMVDNLYQLQYDNDIDNAPERIRLFAGQLMGLDNYLKQMNVK